MAASSRAFRRDPEADAAADAERAHRGRLGDHRRLRLRRLPGPPGLAGAAATCRRRDAPLRLVANQPATRLHSQFDFGGHSAAMKRRGREVMRIHPTDAAARGIADGDIVRLLNARGACLAARRR